MYLLRVALGPRRGQLEDSPQQGPLFARGNQASCESKLIILETCQLYSRLISCTRKISTLHLEFKCVCVCVCVCLVHVLFYHSAYAPYGRMAQVHSFPSGRTRCHVLLLQLIFHLPTPTNYLFLSRHVPQPGHRPLSPELCDRVLCPFRELRCGPFAPLNTFCPPKTAKGTSVSPILTLRSNVCRPMGELKCSQFTALLVLKPMA